MLLDVFGLMAKRIARDLGEKGCGPSSKTYEQGVKCRVQRNNVRSGLGTGRYYEQQS
jgi:hypothetical protein